MLKTLLLSVVLALSVGCSGSSSDPAPAAPTTPAANPDNPPADPTPAPADPDPAQPSTPDGDPVEPTGGTAGVWTGPTDFGTGVYIIDSAENLYGFSSDGNGKYKSLFGPISGLIERFDHRNGDNPALGGAPTVVGDPDMQFASLSYDFAVSEDGRILFNRSALGEFNMALADDNSISVADVVGSWESRTSFCDTCPLTVNMSIAADGSLSGKTGFGQEGTIDPANDIPLSGSVTGGGQYLQIEFNWDGKVRTGVAYREFGSQKLMVNTIGFESDEAGNRAFSALLTRSSAQDPAPTNPAPTDPPPVDPVTPATSATGTWTGPTDFGMGVYIIDTDQNLHGFSSNGAGKFKSLFGPIDGLIERFDHRTSENPALGDAYTVVGDPDMEFANLSYLFTLSEDGLNLTNSSALGNFTMTQAAGNSISIADVVGSWKSRTAFCATCPLEVNINIAASGAVTGDTSFGLEGTLDPSTVLPLAGNLTESGQYLGISFNWDGKVRDGVIYRDVGTQKLVLNTHGFESATDGNRAFSALLTRQ